MSLFLKGIFSFSLLCFSVVFLYFYFDSDFFLSVQGVYSAFLYFILSMITGLRYKNLIYEASGISFKFNDVFLVPAAMNLAGYLIPLKGGGVWLFFYLKGRYRFSAKKALGLILFNIFSIFYFILLIIFYYLFEIGLNPLVIVLGVYGYFLALIVFRAILKLIWARSISFRFSIIEAALVLLHFIVLSWLCYLLVGPVSVILSFSLALFLLGSALIKITPGNIGILEGAAILASQAVPEYGDLFPALAASYRALSVLHAVTAGLPSMVFLTFQQRREKTAGH